METTDCYAMLAQQVKDFHKSCPADGPVLTKIDLHDVIAVIADNGFLPLDFLHVDDGRELILSGEDEARLIANCRIRHGQFRNVRDLNIQAGGRGVFEFTATFTEIDYWEGNYGPRSDATDFHFRFHVDRTGTASYRIA